MPWGRCKRMCFAIKLCHCERSEAIPSPAPQDRPRLHAVTTSAAADLRHVAVSFEKLQT